jgi:hypothetical protein
MSDINEFDSWSVVRPTDSGAYPASELRSILQLQERNAKEENESASTMSAPSGASLFASTMMSLSAMSAVDTRTRVMQTIASLEVTHIQYC